MGIPRAELTNVDWWSMIFNSLEENVYKKLSGTRILPEQTLILDLDLNNNCFSIKGKRSLGNDNNGESLDGLLKSLS